MVKLARQILSEILVMNALWMVVREMQVPSLESLQEMVRVEGESDNWDEAGAEILASVSAWDVAERRVELWVSARSVGRKHREYWTNTMASNSTLVYHAAASGL